MFSAENCHVIRIWFYCHYSKNSFHFNYCQVIQANNRNKFHLSFRRFLESNKSIINTYQDIPEGLCTNKVSRLYSNRQFHIVQVLNISFIIMHCRKSTGCSLCGEQITKEIDFQFIVNQKKSIRRSVKTIYVYLQ